MNSVDLEKLNKAIDKINSLSEAAANRTSWRPITTAPKDGTPILAIKNGVQATVRWRKEERYWTLCVPGTFTLYHDWDPQMWMPLPPGPKEEVKK